MPGSPCRRCWSWSRRYLRGCHLSWSAGLDGRFRRTSVLIHGSGRVLRVRVVVVVPCQRRSSDKISRWAPASPPLLISGSGAFLRQLTVWVQLQNFVGKGGLAWTLAIPQGNRLRLLKVVLWQQMIFVDTVTRYIVFFGGRNWRHHSSIPHFHELGYLQNAF